MDSFQVDSLEQRCFSQVQSDNSTPAATDQGWAHVPPLPLPVAQVRQLPITALAYIGDAVYELYVRMLYLIPPSRSQVFHQKVVAQVKAEKQALHLKALESRLTDAEIEIVRRGRNAAARGPKRVHPEHYQRATGLETLIGYLHLTDPQRLMQVLGYLDYD